MSLSAIALMTGLLLILAGAILRVALPNRQGTGVDIERLGCLLIVLTILILVGL